MGAVLNAVLVWVVDSANRRSHVPSCPAVTTNAT